jgi:hypothetical protein
MAEWQGFGQGMPPANIDNFGSGGKDPLDEED